MGLFAACHDLLRFMGVLGFPTDAGRGKARPGGCRYSHPEERRRQPSSRSASSRRCVL